MKTSLPPKNYCQPQMVSVNTRSPVASRSSSWPRTLAFHAGDRGSNPLRDATFHLSEHLLAFFVPGPGSLIFFVYQLEY